MFSIGEFSRISGLTVKTLRFYHEQGILEPSRVEAGSGYRFYAESKIENARVISALRDLGFTIAEIKEILSSHDDDADLVTILESRRAAIQERIRDERKIIRQLDSIISREREVLAMQSNEFTVERRSIDTVLVASIRMKGKYSECGNGFSRIGKKFGRSINGKAVLLCHDTEYRDDADFEVAMPIRKGSAIDDIEVKSLPGGECLSLMHRGPYDELSRSYKQIIGYAKENGLEYSSPTREVYHKGPGIIFRGNPKNYLTEIQLMLNSEIVEEN